MAKKVSAALSATKEAFKQSKGHPSSLEGIRSRMDMIDWEPRPEVKLTPEEESHPLIKSLRQQAQDIVDKNKLKEEPMAQPKKVNMPSAVVEKAKTAVKAAQSDPNVISGEPVIDKTRHTVESFARRRGAKTVSTGSGTSIAGSDHISGKPVVEPYKPTSNPNVISGEPVRGPVANYATTHTSPKDLVKSVNATTVPSGSESISSKPVVNTSKPISGTPSVNTSKAITGEPVITERVGKPIPRAGYPAPKPSDSGLTGSDHIEAPKFTPPKVTESAITGGTKIPQGTPITGKPIIGPKAITGPITGEPVVGSGIKITGNPVLTGTEGIIEGSTVNAAKAATKRTAAGMVKDIATKDLFAPFKSVASSKAGAKALGSMVGGAIGFAMGNPLRAAASYVTYQAAKEGLKAAKDASDLSRTQKYNEENYGTPEKATATRHMLQGNTAPATTEIPSLPKMTTPTMSPSTIPDTTPPPAPQLVSDTVEKAKASVRDTAVAAPKATKSKGLSPFEQAFSSARKSQGPTGTFTFGGKKYNTKYKEEV